eukprot:gene30286-39507_t
MAGEVQYGGRITDDLDRRLFSAYTEAWLSAPTLNPNFSFNPDKEIVFAKCNELSATMPADYLEVVIQAIRGEVVVTVEIMDAINASGGRRIVVALPQSGPVFRTWLNSGKPNSYWMAGFFNPQGFLTAVQQEITRWALDSVVLHSEVTDLAVEQVRHHPKSGHDGTLVESAPKKLFSLLPVILVTAITKAAKKSVTSNSSYGPFGAYECPVYKYPARTDRYIIFSVLLATMNHKPLHWTLRGVALLCSTN